MIDKTGGRRGPRRAAALAAVAGIAVLTGCSASPVSSGGAVSAQSVTYQADLAFAHCLQTHGVPDFPDPNPSASASITISGQPPANSPAGRAYATCKHLLTSGSAGTGSAGTGTGQPAGSQRRLTAWPRRRVTHLSSSGSPTASSRCWIAGSTAAASRWLCPSRPRQDRCRPRQSPTSGRTWRTSTSGSDCPRRGSRSAPTWRARPPRRGWPARRRWRTPRWCTPSPRTPPSVRSWSARRT